MGAPNVIAIIPARGGSKSIPKKNLKLLGGQPLIAHTIIKANKSEFINRVIVSTDDEEIAKVAKSYGAEVPFLRPNYLAEDDVPVFPVIQHTVGELEKENFNIDIVVVLQPTNPFRKILDIKHAIDKLIETDFDCILSLSEVDQHPFRMRKLVGDKPMPLFNIDKELLYAQRQDLPEIYMLNGSIIVCKRESLMNQTVFYGPDIGAIVVDKLSAWDIDTLVDFQIAEQLLKENEGF